MLADANTITAISGLVLAFSTLIGVVLSHFSTHRALGEVKGEVSTANSQLAVINGATPAGLLEATEGRRIAAEIPPAMRTPAQQHYVDALPEQPAPPAPTHEH